MRLFLTVILGMMLLSYPAGAQEEDYIGTATSALQDVLSNLKQSVEKLSLDNSQLAARDNAMKQQVLELQTELGRVQAQGDLLNKTADQWRGNNPGRAQQIARLENENSDLDNHIQKTQDSIKLIQPSLVAPSPDYQAGARRQKEKLRLMKMIYDSQQRQEILHEAILEFQKKIPVLPAAAVLEHQQDLKEQIKDLEDQIAGYQAEKPSLNSGPANQWDDTQMHQLELELKDLEKNYLQLKDLMEQMTKKVKVARMTVSQHIEEEKLQGNMDDLNRQAVGLRADLDDLRSQMIVLDKRKSHLETMIQHLP